VMIFMRRIHRLPTKLNQKIILSHELQITLYFSAKINQPIVMA